MSHQLYNKEWKSWSNLGKEPKNIESPYEEFSSNNISCGDEVNLQISIRNNKISSIGYEVKGCSICMGTMAFLAEYLKGQSLENSLKVIETIENILYGTLDSNIPNELNHFKILQQFPTRVQCVKISTQIVKKAILSRQ